MINVDSNTVEAWKDNEPKTVRIELDGVEIPQSKIETESMQIEESICDTDSLHYMGCIPARLELKVRGIDTDIIGQYLQVFAAAGDTTEIALFSGYVTSANLDATKTTVNLIAYDKLYEINNLDVGEWFRTRVFPMTLKQFRDGFFSFLQIDQEETTLCNDSMIIRETIGGSIKGSTILTSICEICGVFGAMSRDGQTFIYKSLSQSYLDTIEASNIISFVHEDFTCKPINRLIIRADSDDVGVVAGTGTNTYIIQGNVLAYDQSTQELQTVANNLISQIFGGSYVPMTIESVGNVIYEAGDFIRFETAEGSYITSYILSRKLKGIFSLHDDLEGKGVENYGNALQNNYDEMIQLRGQASRFKRTLEGVTSEVETIRDDYASKSQLQQTSDSLTAQIEYLQQEIDGDVAIYYTNEPPTLLNYPAWDFTYNIPCNNTVQLRDDLQFEYTESYYQKNLRALVYDEVNNIAYRFVKEEGVFGWREVADTEMGAVLQRLSSLELTTEGITAQVSEIETNYATKNELSSTVQQTAQSITSTVSATYQTKNDAETVRESLQSQITQSASQINLKVSKGSVVSEINQSADQITLNSNRLVINSTNFTLSSDGKVTCNSAVLNNARFISNDTGKNPVISIGNDSNGKTYILSTGVEVTNEYGTTRIAGNYIDTKTLNASSIHSYRTGETIIVGSKLQSIEEVKILNDSQIGISSSKVGFFGNAGTTRKRVSNATSSNILTQLNALIDALHGYGLINKY